MNTDLNDKAFKGKVEFWAGYTDVGTEGVFLSKDGREMLSGIKNKLQWSWGEPNGRHIENCAVLQSLYSNLMVDKSCDALAFVTCQFLSRPKFMFRGENVLNLDLSEYFVLELGDDISPADYQLKSFYGATIKQLEINKQLTWVLQKNLKNLATQNTSIYFPVGSSMWKNLMDDKFYEMNLNACSEDEFSCKDGTCVSKWNRCDKTYDCYDESDELNCDYVVFPSKYDSLTPPRNSSKRTLLNISIKIIRILDINIEAESFKLKLKFETHWTDGGLVFQNLQRNRTNILERDDWIRMWTPNFLFTNTENTYTSRDMTNEADSSVQLVLTDSEVMPDEKSSLMRNFKYKGSSVDIFKDNVYTVEFECEFDWKNYPFDIQTCPIVITLSTTNPELVDFNVLSSLNAQSYSNYIIEQGNVSIIDQSTKDVQFEIPLIFKRDTKSILLNTYLPTIILTMINQLTNYYIGYEMFEAVITINATTLLTLTSLFISVFDSLPQTTDIKLIDVWMLITFVYPFIIIIIHTLVHVNSRNHSKKAKKVEWMLMAFGKVGLPIIFGVFTVVYAVIGANLLLNSNST